VQPARVADVEYPDAVREGDERDAEGNVKPSHAATPPSRPARVMPMAMPT
jgi:hypothetical protein